LWRAWADRPANAARVVAICLGLVAVVSSISAHAPHRDLAATAIILVLAGMVWRCQQPARQVVTAMLLTFVVGFGAGNRLREMTAYAKAAVENRLGDDASAPVALTPGLLRGMHWIRANTSPRDVLAVSNYFDGHPGDAHRPPAFMYYSAFSERRVYLEGWIYTRRADELGYRAVLANRLAPFPGRRRLNDLVFQRGDRAALTALMRRGVRFLVVDKARGGRPAVVRPLGREVYSNSAVEIIAVHP
jgi:hypothetical protein